MNDELDNAAAEYVLGTLPADERARFAGRLDHDPEARRLVRQWEARLAALGESAPAEPPPAGLWRRIEAAIPAAGRTVVAFPQRGDTPGYRRSLAAWRATALGAAALAAASLAWIFVDGTFTEPQDAGGRYVAVVDTGGREPALIAEVDTRTGTILVRSLAAQIPEGRSLELWHLAEGQAPRSLGVLQAGLEPQSIQDQPSAGPVEGQIAVTVEPPGGSPSGNPTGPIVYSGRLVPMEE